MLVGVAVLAVIAPAVEPGESRAEAAPPALSAADAPAPRFTLVPIVASPIRPAVRRLGVDHAVLADPATVRVLRARTRTVASRSAVRRPVRPPLVAQRFTRSAVAKRSALPQAAKPRPAARRDSTGPGRAAGRRYAGGGHRIRAAAGAPSFAEGRGMSAVIAYAWGQVGKSYVSGADGPFAFDCSGLTMQAYKRAGIDLPHSSGAQAAMARMVSRAEARPGDLVVGAGHVGIYLGDGMMIDAGNSRVGVTYRRMYDGLHIERFF